MGRVELRNAAAEQSKEQTTSRLEELLLLRVGTRREWWIVKSNGTGPAVIPFFQRGFVYADCGTDLSRRSNSN